MHLPHIATGLACLIAAAKADQSVFKSADDAHVAKVSPLHPPSLTYIPSIGLGLWNSKSSNATSAVQDALSTGYRHLDSAAAYTNEEYVGLALNGTELSSIPRSAYWITSKLWNTAHRPNLVKPALRRTLSDLNTTYLDLYLMHWPVAFEPGTSDLDNGTTIFSTWRAMEQLVRDGVTRHIGISNFAKHQVEDILRVCTICPVAHEFEMHPYLQQQALVDWHHKAGMQVIAYSPLGNVNPTYHSELPSILEDKFWVEMADKKGVTPAQAILAWGIQRGTVVIPKSTHARRIQENWVSQGVRFSQAEMQEIAGQDRKARFNNPSKSWGVDLFDDLD